MMEWVGIGLYNFSGLFQPTDGAWRSPCFPKVHAVHHLKPEDASLTTWMWQPAPGDPARAGSWMRPNGFPISTYTGCVSCCGNRHWAGWMLRLDVALSLWLSSVC